MTSRADLPDVPSAPTEPMLVPVTGEIIDPRQTDVVLAALLHLREWKRREFDPFIAALEAAVLEHAMDVDARYTLRLGGLVATGTSPQAAGVWEYRYDELRQRLRDAGLSAEEVDAAVKPTVSYRVDEARMRMLAAHPRYGVVVEECRTRVPKRRSVSVKRDG